jgi:uncharacterized protein YdeI (YjbR/CyaY-like superfamily)
VCAIAENTSSAPRTGTPSAAAAYAWYPFRASMATKTRSAKTSKPTTKPARRTETKKTGPSPSDSILFRDAKAFREYLEEHHSSSTGIWLRFAKKGSGITSVSYSDALDVALAFGWIDGQARPFDESSWLQRFTPRGPRSIWSKRNRERIAALVAAGAMHPRGLAEVERAKSDGRWEAAYDSPSKATVPDDLAAALARNEKAASQFAKLDSRNRFSILFRVHQAKKPETRQRRIAEFVAMLARGEKLHP